MPKIVSAITGTIKENGKVTGNIFSSFYGVSSFGGGGAVQDALVKEALKKKTEDEQKAAVEKKAEQLGLIEKKRVSQEQAIKQKQSLVNVPSSGTKRIYSPGENKFYFVKGSGQYIQEQTSNIGARSKAARLSGEPGTAGRFIKYEGGLSDVQLANLRAREQNSPMVLSEGQFRVKQNQLPKGVSPEAAKTANLLGVSVRDVVSYSRKGDSFRLEYKTGYGRSDVAVGKSTDLGLSSKTLVGRASQVVDSVAGMFAAKPKPVSSFDFSVPAYRRESIVKERLKSSSPMVGGLTLGERYLEPFFVSEVRPRAEVLGKSIEGVGEFVVGTPLKLAAPVLYPRFVKGVQPSQFKVLNPEVRGSLQKESVEFAKSVGGGTGRLASWLTGPGLAVEVGRQKSLRDAVQTGVEFGAFVGGSKLVKGVLGSKTVLVGKPSSVVNLRSLGEGFVAEGRSVQPVVKVTPLGKLSGELVAESKVFSLSGKEADSILGRSGGGRTPFSKVSLPEQLKLAVQESKLLGEEIRFVNANSNKSFSPSLRGTVLENLGEQISLNAKAVKSLRKEGNKILVRGNTPKRFITDSLISKNPNAVSDAKRTLRSIGEVSSFSNISKKKFALNYVIPGVEKNVVIDALAKEFKASPENILKEIRKTKIKVAEFPGKSTLGLIVEGNTPIYVNLRNMNKYFTSTQSFNKGLKELLLHEFSHKLQIKYGINFKYKLSGLKGIGKKGYASYLYRPEELQARYVSESLKAKRLGEPLMNISNELAEFVKVNKQKSSNSVFGSVPSLESFDSELLSVGRVKVGETKFGLLKKSSGVSELSLDREPLREFVEKSRKLSVVNEPESFVNLSRVKFVERFPLRLGKGKSAKLVELGSRKGSVLGKQGLEAFSERYVFVPTESGFRVASVVKTPKGEQRVLVIAEESQFKKFKSGMFKQRDYVYRLPEDLGTWIESGKSVKRLEGNRLLLRELSESVEEKQLRKLMPDLSGFLMPKDLDVKVSSSVKAQQLSERALKEYFNKVKLFEAKKVRGALSVLKSEPKVGLGSVKEVSLKSSKVVQLQKPELKLSKPLSVSKIKVESANRVVRNAFRNQFVGLRPKLGFGSMTERLLVQRRIQKPLSELSVRSLVGSLKAGGLRSGSELRLKSLLATVYKYDLGRLQKLKSEGRLKLFSPLDVLRTPVSVQRTEFKPYVPVVSKVPDRVERLPLVEFNERLPLDKVNDIFPKAFKAVITAKGKPSFESKPLSFLGALQVGIIRTGGTAKRTFRVESVVGRPQKVRRVLDVERVLRTQYRKPIKGGVSQLGSSKFIERTKFAINEPGELREITFKGIVSSRKKKLKKKRRSG